MILLLITLFRKVRADSSYKIALPTEKFGKPLIKVWADSSSEILTPTEKFGKPLINGLKTVPDKQTENSDAAVASKQPLRSWNF